MDHTRFDNLTRSIGRTSTRRQFSGMLGALGLGSVASLSLLGANEAEAGKKRVKVCHNGQTIKIRKSKLKVHLAHGDTKGPCPVCVPDCTGPLGPKDCGSDGCGGSCGTCPSAKPICNAITAVCEAICVPDCDGPFGPKECGDDGCGGTCGTCPSATPICNVITFTCDAIVP
jgi:hypothetical protein